MVEGLWPWGLIPLREEEYNELKEKAEKWNELCEGLEYSGNTPVRDILLEFNLIDRDNELRRKKLEAVKNQIDEFPCVHVQDYQRMMKKIKKILEGEG